MISSSIEKLSSFRMKSRLLEIVSLLILVRISPVLIKRKFAGLN